MSFPSRCQQCEVNQPKVRYSRCGLSAARIEEAAREIYAGINGEMRNARPPAPRDPAAFPVHDCFRVFDPKQFGHTSASAELVDEFGIDRRFFHITARTQPFAQDYGSYCNGANRALTER